MHYNRTVDLELADEGLGEISGDAGGDACCGLQRGQDGQISHLNQALLFSRAYEPEILIYLSDSHAPGQTCWL